jgi:hypothetical protein
LTDEAATAENLVPEQSTIFKMMKQIATVELQKQ